MKVAVLIPDRRDRPAFLKNCLRMLKEQTLQPDIIEIVDDEPLNDLCDITWRYRTGYDRLRNKGVDVIAFIENDDFYCKKYLEIMVNQWVLKGKPNLLGLTYTIYYNLKFKYYFPFNHLTRSSAMNTLIKADMDFKWCVDHQPFTDAWLWSKLKGVVFNPPYHICIGIKHGVGKCGGQFHTDRLDRYQRTGIPDPEMKFLQSVMDIDSLNFYANYLENE